MATVAMAYLLVMVMMTNLLMMCGTQDTNSCQSGYEYRSDTDSGTLRCALCRVGYYSTSGRHAECVRCPTGYVTRREGAVDVTECRRSIGNTDACSSGSEWSSQEERCIPCSEGYYRQRGVDYWCVMCPEGMNTSTFAATSRDMCLPANCPLGTEWRGGMCEPCDYGYHGDAVTSSCVPCRIGYITLTVGSKSPNDCFQPPSGYELFTSDDCLLGTEYVTPDTPGVAARGCRACPMDTYRDRTDLSVCEPCASGLYTLQVGSVRCYSALQLQTVTDQGHILGETMVPDLHCPLGTEQGQNPLACFRCASGTYRNVTTIQLCQDCGVTPIPPGKGFIDESLCHGGSQGRMFDRGSCPPGTEWRLDKCSACPYGTYTSSPGMTSCIPCPQGTTTLTPAATSRLLCSVASDNLQQPYFTSDDCPAGSEWVPTLSMCKECPIGWYRPRDSLSQLCTPCDAGTTTTTTGSTQAYQCFVPLDQPDVLPIGRDGCEPGYEPNQDYSACTPCDFGSYKHATSHDMCTLCPQVPRYLRTLTQSKGSRSATACYPRIDSVDISPTHGPQSGGTQLSILITSSRPVTVTSVYLTYARNQYQCRIINAHATEDYFVRCTTSASRELSSGDVIIEIEGLDERIEAAQRFTYEPDPVITGIISRTTIASGGYPVLVGGEHFNTTGSSQLIVRDPQHSTLTWIWACSVQDAYTLACSTGALEEQGITRMRRDAEQLGMKLYPFGVELDGITMYRDLRPLLGNDAYLEVYPDPVVHPVPEELWIRDTESDGYTLTLMGENLIDVATVADYTVAIGENCTASITALNDTTMEVDMCTNITRGVNHTLQVTLKSLVFHPGYVWVYPEATTSGDYSNGGTTAPPTTPSGGGGGGGGGGGQKDSSDDDDDDILMTVVVPVLAVLCALLLIIAIVIVIYRYRLDKKQRQPPPFATRDSSRLSFVSNSLLLHQKPSPSSSEPHLPPLPHDAVFGYQRKTDSGTPMRQLAFPVDYPYSSELEDSMRTNDLMRYKLAYAGHYSPKF